MLFNVFNQRSKSYRYIFLQGSSKLEDCLTDNKTKSILIHIDVSEQSVFNLNKTSKKKSSLRAFIEKYYFEFSRLLNPLISLVYRHSDTIFEFFNLSYLSSYFFLTWAPCILKTKHFRTRVHKNIISYFYVGNLTQKAQVSLNYVHVNVGVARRRRFRANTTQQKGAKCKRL